MHFAAREKSWSGVAEELDEEVGGAEGFGCMPDSLSNASLADA